MNLAPPFEEFLFNQSLAYQLDAFIKRPSALPQVVCFYGEPGIGKTSFALAFARHFGEYCSYHPMNETNINAGFIKHLNMSTAQTLVDFFRSDDKPFSTVTILDEFHNLAHKSQDFFKTQFDALGERDRVIVCLNTTDRKSLKQSVTAPIYSRMTAKINFTLPPDEHDEFAKQIANRFLYLELDEIKSSLPDMRQISKLNEMRKALAA